MNTVPMRRREFLGATGAAAIAFAARQSGGEVLAPSKPALLGGPPVRSTGFPTWPQPAEAHARALQAALEAKAWSRGNGGTTVDQFEKEYAQRLGAAHCLATNSGTSALFACLNALDVGPGDEVLVPPYTFVATVNVVLLQHALPVFVDVDRETFQIDAAKAAAAVTPETRVLLPVHLGGNVADLDAFLALAKEKNLALLEDACQSHLAEWRGKCVGTLGDMGCFSFQVTKNLSSGEGGAIVTNREELLDEVYSFHSAGRARAGTSSFSYVRCGGNLRMTEFQGAILLEQLKQLEAQSQTRQENAARLTERLKEIPGLSPAAQYEGCTRNAYHLYMLRYDPQAFSGLTRDRFLEALRAEGIPASGGYSPLNKEPFLRRTLESRGFQRIYGKQRIEEYFERTQLPENDRLCSEAVWFTQNMLLGPRQDVEDIADAIEKIHAHAAALAV